MCRSKNIVLFIALWLLIQNNFYSQNNSKVWFDGLGRSFFSRDAIVDKLNEDTISSKNVSSGYNLLDLNTHVNPSKDIEIFAQLRIKNQFGSFFGSGTNINVRQLRASGIINNKINFNVGDIFLKQNHFTLYNNNEDLNFYKYSTLNPYMDIIHYENFYIDNRWRLQGIQTDFSYEFDRFIRTFEVDMFITRPRGSVQLNNNSFSPDLILGGGSLSSKISNNLFFELNYINLYEIPSSGTTNISIRNPVYHSALTYQYKRNNLNLMHKIQSGFSQRNWLLSDIGIDMYDSSYNFTEGMFFEFENELLNKDSTFSTIIGFRYVDPNFRSSGAQTRRLNFNNFENTVYPFYTNNYINREVSLFDITTDENIYNQELHGSLMEFNPMYSNVNPYGLATPNRRGIYAELNWKSGEVMETNLTTSIFEEVIGQGTTNKRNFLSFLINTKINIDQIFNLKKEISFCAFYRNENTSRFGDSISAVNLSSEILNSVLNIELGNKIYLRMGIKQFKSTGNEFLTNRNNYGIIQSFSAVSYDKMDFLNNVGIYYKLKDNIYANIQYNWWGSIFNNSLKTDFNYNRILFIFSVTL